MPAGSGSPSGLPRRTWSTCACRPPSRPAAARSARSAPGRSGRCSTRSSRSACWTSRSASRSSGPRASAAATSPSWCWPTGAGRAASSARRSSTARCWTVGSSRCAGALGRRGRSLRTRLAGARKRPPCLACDQGASAVETALGRLVAQAGEPAGPRRCRARRSASTTSSRSGRSPTARRRSSPSPRARSSASRRSGRACRASSTIRPSTGGTCWPTTRAPPPARRPSCSAAPSS